MGYHITGQLSDQEKEFFRSLVGASAESDLTVSFETEQMGSFRDEQVMVVNHRRTGLDEIADFVEGMMMSPGAKRHAIFNNEPSELDAYAREDMDRLKNRFSSNGVTVHETLKAFEEFSKRN